MSFSSFLVIVVLFCILFIVFSGLMMDRYLWKRKLIPKWQIITGFGKPLLDIKAYINSTKQEYGRVGIWIKIFIGSFILMMVIGILLAIFNPER